MRRVVGVAIVLASVVFAATHNTGALTTSSRPRIASSRVDPRSSRPQRAVRLRRGVVSTTNWAGWANTGARFTDVRASWRQPDVNCATAARQYAAFWVGLDGYNSNSVEQIGTDSDCAGTNRPVYYGWYEMFPAAPVNLPLRTYPIAPHDTMSAIVSVSGPRFSFVLINWTRGWVYRATRYSSTAQLSSAEWITEAPAGCNSFGCRVLPLADFGSVSFTNASTVDSQQPAVISTAPNDAVIMANNRGTALKAMPSPLNNRGNGFTVMWKHS
jgi:hypothetical protein